jgi:hypothetical protein
MCVRTTSSDLTRAACNAVTLVIGLDIRIIKSDDDCFSSVAVFLKRTQRDNWTAREYPMTDSHGDLVVFRPFL